MDVHKRPGENRGAYLDRLIEVVEGRVVCRDAEVLLQHLL